MPADRHRLGRAPCSATRRASSSAAGSGRGFLERHGPRVKITARAARAGRALLRAPRRQDDPDRPLHRPGPRDRAVHRRLVGDARTAGSSPTASSARGCGRRCSALLGFFFCQSFDKVAHVAGQAAFVFGVVVASIVGGRLGVPAPARARSSARADRRGSTGRASARCCVRSAASRGRSGAGVVARRPRAAPQVRFVWRRLTPGELGLELTTALAIAGVGFYVFVALRRGARPATPAHAVRPRAARPGRRPARRRRRRRGEGRDRARLAPGRSPSCSSRRRRAGARAGGRSSSRCSSAGSSSSTSAVHLAKAGIDRPRPARPARRDDARQLPERARRLLDRVGRRGVIAATRVGAARRARALVLGAVALAAADRALARLPARALLVRRRRRLGARRRRASRRWRSIALIVAYIRHNGRARAGRLSRWTSTCSTTEIALARRRRRRRRRLRRLILCPAWAAYGRLWEKSPPAS